MTLRCPDTIVCIASGASLTQADVDYCRNKARVLVVNDNYRLAPWADWLYACDGAWWRVYASDVQDTFAGECWTRDQPAADKYGLHWIESSPEPGLSRDPWLIREGKNSGYQAINLAYHFGAKRIVLLGYDMGGSHWFGEHPQSLPVKSNYDAFRREFPALARDLKAEGVEVINCSRNTILDVFRQSTVGKVL